MMIKTAATILTTSTTPAADIIIIIIIYFDLTCIGGTISSPFEVLCGV
jgi:hypothetical protein